MFVVSARGTRPRCPRGSCGGFTLVELLVVLAIGAVLATITVVSLAAMAPAYQLDHVVQVVNGQARYARTMAKSEKTRYRIAIDGNSQIVVDRMDAGSWVNFSSLRLPDRVRVRAGTSTMPADGYELAISGRADSTLVGTGAIYELIQDPDRCICLTLDNFLMVNFRADAPPCTVGAATCS